MVTTTNEVCDNTEVCAADVQVAAITEQAITEEDFEKAQKTFQLGKKNLFLNKYDESVNNIGDACKIYSSKYGELDPQCAEVYFFYGKALLELARVENTVLGNALNGVPEDTGPIDDSRYGNPEELPAEEKEEISEKVIDALCEPQEGTAEPKETTTTETPAATTTEEVKKTETTETTETTEKPVEEKKETAVEGGETTEEKKNGEAAAAEGEEEEGDEEEEEDEEEGEDITKNDEQAKDEAEAEDISNLQRSWEMFELAKIIYQKNFDNDLTFKNKRIAECLLKLGEISIEQEIYDQAITDITESIRIQEEQKENRDERFLAESFYQLALAQQFNNQFTEANESYQKSINIMQLRIEKLKGKLTMVTGEDADAELERTGIKDEIAELEALLPEMMSKLEEVTEQGQQSLNLIKEAKECFLNSGAGGEERPAVVGEVKDITSMVKSKRKQCGDESPVIENDVKKTKLGNGETTTTTTEETNGGKKEEETTKSEQPAEQPMDAPTEITA